MADNDPLADVFNLLAAPVAGTIRSFEQFRKGVDEFLKGVENFNTTMENLNETSQRINALLAEVEEPIKAAMPQVTRTVKAADEMMQVVAGPAMAAAPGLVQLGQTLNNPAFAQMPKQFEQMTAMLTEVTNRLAPLGQLAESAGGIFGGLRFPGFGPSTKPAATTPPVAAVPEPDDVDDEPAPTTGTGAKKAPAKKRAARKRTTKKSTARTKSSSNE